MAESSEDLEICYFDLRLVHDNFDRSLMEEDDVDIKAYLEAYTELYKYVKYTRILSHCRIK